MKIKILFLCSLLLIGQTAFAWNLAAKHIHQLEFFGDGKIRFTLYETGDSGTTFQCSSATGSAGLWFVIQPCGDSKQQCLSANERMGSMLLASKLSSTPVHVHRDNCIASRVALAP